MAARRYPAARAVAEAVRDGRLPDPTTLRCEDCGAPAVCYDHRDYRQPLVVAPVCKRCDCLRGPGLPYEPACPYGTAWARRQRAPISGARA